MKKSLTSIAQPCRTWKATSCVGSSRPSASSFSAAAYIGDNPGVSCLTRSVFRQAAYGQTRSSRYQGSDRLKAGPVCLFNATVPSQPRPGPTR